MNIAELASTIELAINQRAAAARAPVFVTRVGFDTLEVRTRPLHGPTEIVTVQITAAPEAARTKKEAA